MALKNYPSIEGSTKPNSIDVDSYEALLSAARVIGIPSNQQELVDLSAYPVIYIGTAGQGFSQSSGIDNNPNVPNWMIQQVTIGSSSITTQIGWGPWADRATLTYS